jgi:hypothetical protein
MKATLKYRTQGEQMVKRGDVYLLPDLKTGFGIIGKSRPWIVKSIVGDVAILSPRTTKLTSENRAEGVFLPIDYSLGFTKPGVILQEVEREFKCERLGGFEKLGNARWRLERMSCLKAPRSEEKETWTSKKVVHTSRCGLRNPVLTPEMATILKAQRSN